MEKVNVINTIEIDINTKDEVDLEDFNVIVHKKVQEVNDVKVDNFIVIEVRNEKKIVV